MVPPRPEGDPGLYYLALHGFVAGFLGADPQSPVGPSLIERLSVLRDDLDRDGRLTAAARTVIGALEAHAAVTMAVAEDRARITLEEAKAASYTFLRWCTLMGFDDPAVEHIRRGLESWGAGALNEHLPAPGGDSRALQAELETFNATPVVPEAGSPEARDYVSYLQRFTLYARSRGDYQRSVMALSEEQQALVNRLAGPGDFLISGPPGSGKTLVLLHALDAHLTGQDQELGVVAESPVVLLTYTRTLVRFSAYLAHIIGRHRFQPHIATVDAFLLARLRDVVDEGYLVFDSRSEQEFGELLAPTVAALDPIGFEQLWREIDSVIFAGGLEREDYLQARRRTTVEAPAVPVDPAGTLSLATGGKERRLIWDASILLAQAMEERGGYSKHRALWRITQGIRPDMKARRIYLDESQDLAPAEIAALKALSEQGVVMAGDDYQRIYRSGLRFTDAGLDIRGRSRSLRKNYRNTQAIWSLAEEYRTGASDVSATREGPEPELQIVPSYEDGLRAVVARCTFTQTALGYIPEHLAVMTPSKDHLRDLVGEFQRRGVHTSSLRSRSFDFQTTSGVRLSTMHSAKGVEFPVVILFIPGFKEGDEELQRNLVYVAITRAMDHLLVVIPHGDASPAIGDLKSCMERRLVDRAF
jgi:superfamily I DNA/RNA helicase